MKTHISATNRRRSAVLFGALLAGLVGLNLAPALAGPGVYTSKAKIPVTLEAGASAAVDGILYVAGGVQSFPTHTNSLFAYDSWADTWTKKMDMPTARASAAAAAVDGILYVTGGAVSLTF